MERMGYDSRSLTARAVRFLLFLTVLAGLLGMHGIGGGTLAIAGPAPLSTTQHGTPEHRDDAAPDEATTVHEGTGEHGGDRGDHPAPSPGHGHDGPLCCEAGGLPVGSFLLDHGDLVVCPAAGELTAPSAWSRAALSPGSGGCDPPGRSALQIWRI